MFFYNVEVSPEEDPIGAVLFFRFKNSKGGQPSTSDVVTEAEAKKKKCPLFPTPKLKLAQAAPTVDFTVASKEPAAGKAPASGIKKPAPKVSAIGSKVPVSGMKQPTGIKPLSSARKIPGATKEPESPAPTQFENLEGIDDPIAISLQARQTGGKTIETVITEEQARRQKISVFKAPRLAFKGADT
jgi:hypothetical protein